MNDILNWLQGSPYCQDYVSVDQIQYRPDSCGLFPMGIEVVATKTDIVGNTKQRLRSRYELRRITARHRDQMEAADWMKQFQLWVLSQGAEAPQLGENTRWTAKNGRLAKSDRPDTCIYTVDLVAEYDK